LAWRLAVRVDYDEFRRLWADQTVTKGQICERFGITRWRLADIARILDLDDDRDNLPFVDPTPEEIRERAAEIRSKWPDCRWAEYYLAVDYSRSCHSA
jgi:hypothetical protein